MSDGFGVRVLGLDPGFANIGLFGLTLYPIGEHANFVKVITTKKESKKRRLRQYDDETRRLEQIEREFDAVLTDFNPDIVSAEQFATLRNAGTTRQIALAYGAMHALAKRRNIHFLAFGPQEIKLEIAGKRSATKTAIFDALKKKFPAFDAWPTTKKLEHVSDAGGAALLARYDPLVGLLLRERAG
jgi:Holliday junction resolvasome RuvABC endonuclease subunit